MGLLAGVLRETTINMSTLKSMQQRCGLVRLSADSSTVIRLCRAQWLSKTRAWWAWCIGGVQQGIPDGILGSQPPIPQHDMTTWPNMHLLMAQPTWRMYHTHLHSYLYFHCISVLKHTFNSLPCFSISIFYCMASGNTWTKLSVMCSHEAWLVYTYVGGTRKFVSHRVTLYSRVLWGKDDISGAMTNANYLLYPILTLSTHH